MVQILLVLAQAAQASSSVPSWLSYIGPFVGGIGLALAYERWIVENRIQAQKEKLDAELAKEKQQKEWWEKQAKQAAQDADIAYQALEETLRDLSEQDLSSNDVVRLNRILGKLKRWSSLDQQLSDYKIAAGELKQPFIVSLFAKASQRAIKDCKSKIPELQEFLPWKRHEIIQKFYADIEGYVNWVYDCLYVSGHPMNNPLSRFVEGPALSSSEPYITAITYIKDQGDWSRLTIEQSRALRLMFDELLKRLPEEF